MDEKSQYNIFNNPMIESAMKSMTPEQIEAYQKMGQYMYSTTDFENPQPKSLEDDMVNALFYIKEALKAGLHPKDMTKKEIQIMYDTYGDKWYEDYGYEGDEVPEPDIKIKLNGVDPNQPLLSDKQLKKIEKKLEKKKLKKELKNKGINRKKI